MNHVVPVSCDPPATPVTPRRNPFSAPSLPSPSRPLPPPGSEEPGCMDPSLGDPFSYPGAVYVGTSNYQQYIRLSKYSFLKGLSTFFLNYLLVKWSFRGIWNWYRIKSEVNSISIGMIFFFHLISQFVLKHKGKKSFLSLDFKSMSNTSPYPNIKDGVS